MPCGFQTNSMCPVKSAEVKLWTSHLRKCPTQAKRNALATSRQIRMGRHVLAHTRGPRGPHRAREISLMGTYFENRLAEVGVDGLWHEDDSVEVRYPLPDSNQQDRSSWPWLPGTVLEVCGPDEWLICVKAYELATLEDGSPPHRDTSDYELFYPTCFRDSSEIRPPKKPGEPMPAPDN